MEFDRERAKLLSENLVQFSRLVSRNDEHLKHLSNENQLYRLKNLVDEYKLPLLASEIERINRFSWDSKQMAVLIARVRTAITSIDDYIEQNQEGLFFYSARIHTIKEICSSFTTV